MHFVGERGGSGGWWCCTGGWEGFFFWLGSGQLLGWGDLHCIGGGGGGSGRGSDGGSDGGLSSGHCKRLAVLHTTAASGITLLSPSTTEGISLATERGHLRLGGRPERGGRPGRGGLWGRTEGLPSSMAKWTGLMGVGQRTSCPLETEGTFICSSDTRQFTHFVAAEDQAPSLFAAKQHHHNIHRHIRGWHACAATPGGSSSCDIGSFLFLICC